MAQIGAKQERLITALLSEPSVTSAAAKAVVSARPARRWLASPEFQARLKQAKSDVFNHAKGNLQAGMVEATRTLREGFWCKLKPPVKSIRLRLIE